MARRSITTSTIEVQLIDDPAEFHDPRPNPGLLGKLARATGGTVIQSPTDLANMLGRHKDATVQTIVTRAPDVGHPLAVAVLAGFALDRMDRPPDQGAGVGIGFRCRLAQSGKFV